MGEQIQGGVCGGSLWINPSANLFRSSTCSLSSINGSGWPSHDPPLAAAQAARSLSNDSAGSCSDGPGSVVIDPEVKPSQENVSMASTLQMMGINLSSHLNIDANWNQDFIHESGKSEENYAHNLQPSLMDPTGINDFGQNPGFQFNSTQFNYSSPLLQTLFDVESNQLGQQLQMNNHQSINYVSSQNYVNPTEFCPNLPNNKVQKPQHGNSHLQFANNAHFWSSSASNFVPSSTAQFVRPSSLHSGKSNFHNLSTKQHIQENGRGLISSAAQKKATLEPAIKRPRVENPSPLPAFKVRKEKLGDRITALQQLVSPFGKTDTASVLHEAIEYIKFLHEQVSVLSTPYLKNGSPHQLQHQQIWRLLSKPNLFLSKVLKENYFPVGCVLEAKPSQSTSWMLQKGTFKVERREANVDTFTWVRELLPDRRWNMELLHNLFTPETCDAILKICTLELTAKDRWVSCLELKGKFSVASTYSNFILEKIQSLDRAESSSSSLRDKNARDKDVET
ncbi:basic helix-loop-helix (bHLH) DNA-bindingsuperfamily protein [Striga asiatica]|uniref:Basic helix-loop-helix (BHLH) DNA-bindingsuperfamily protein n=1 Tax=Striga asiatica TaxID=4170 RepID=A0A5A7PG21_STRAF|nr:basic helix-loop-helix (bHLH) DNA-bindingsuperfamily protein [Striga asiatica]